MENPIPEDRHAQIAEVAYRIYEDAGCPEGCSAEHWARAERIVLERAGSDREGPAAESLETPGEVVP